MSDKRDPEIDKLIEEFRATTVRVPLSRRERWTSYVVAWVGTAVLMLLFIACVNGHIGIYVQ